MRVSFAVMLLLAVATTTACRTEEQRVRDAFSARLKSSSRLTPLELAQLMDEATRAMTGKKMRLQRDGVSHEPNEQERASIVLLLGGAISVEDAGARQTNASTLRGVMGPVTPVNSELEAVATIWVDADSFLPRRYEFTSGQPGSGDYSYDISW